MTGLNAAIYSWPNRLRLELEAFYRVRVWSDGEVEIERVDG